MAGAQGGVAMDHAGLQSKVDPVAPGSGEGDGNARRRAEATTRRLSGQQKGTDSIATAPLPHPAIQTGERGNSVNLRTEMAPGGWSHSWTSCRYRIL